MLLELLRPFSYLTIRHRSMMPYWVNFFLPTVAATVAVALVWLLDLRVDVFGANGLVSKMQSFVQGLPGFYIAALAAIATFNNPDMDKAMPGESPTMFVTYNGARTKVKVTRRRFLSVMFAYLTACSLMLTLISVATVSLADPLTSVLPKQVFGTAKVLFCTAYLTCVAQLVFVTLWGLFYLGERIHTPNA